jgi:outer membrane protein OmpA-like peptidoglycan-associated protein
MIVTIVVCLTGIATLHAQMRSEVGLTLLGVSAIHNADLRALPGVPSCCPAYGDGSGIGGTIAISYAIPLTHASRLVIRGGYSVLNGTLERDESVIVAGGKQGVFRHTVDASFADITIEPLYRHTLMSDLYAAIGVRAGLITSATFSQRETIVEPGDGTFPGGQRTRNRVDDADVPEAATYTVGLVGVLGYDLPLQKHGRLRLVPEISYVYPLTNLVNGVDWTMSQVRFGVALNVRLGSIDPLVPGAPSPETAATVAPVAVPVVAARDDASPLVAHLRTVQRDERDTDTAGIVVDETISVFMTPLLGHVYFEDGSPVIPDRYDRDPGDTVDRLTIYHRVLDTLGRRLRADPGSTVTLVGCRADGGSDRTDPTLGERRAAAVRDHLVNVWGISSERIRVVGRGLPERASEAPTAEGAQENRRVEIVARPSGILAPVVLRDTVWSVGTARVVIALAGLDERRSAWDVSVRAAERVVWRANGVGVPTAAVEWDLRSADPEELRGIDTVWVTARRSGVDGVRDSLVIPVPVRQRTLERKRREGAGNVEIARYGLMLFNVRSADISTEDRPIIDMIRSNVLPGSRVTVIGYTDRVGDPVLNDNLAAQRARAVVDALRLPPDIPVVLRSQGNAVLYDPSIPEGRAYTRTVEVVIERP